MACTDLLDSLSTKQESVDLNDLSIKHQHRNLSAYDNQSSQAAKITKANVSLHTKTNYKRINIKVENIQFSVKTGFLHTETKQILKGLSGEFRSGELSAIVGPSGAGKTKFVKIISGYTEIGYSGNIRVNGFARDTKLFRSNSSFVMQDTTMQSHLTVSELMDFAASLKIGDTISENAKNDKVRNILETIDLYGKRHSKAGHLSGGEIKRLNIALELISDPPVLILDEPTSGLDAFNANKCISMLKEIAMEGRTVICTIHQLSSLAFSAIDHLYAIADGRCIYSGSTQNVVPFLAELNLYCPISYNPADYLIEIATHSYGDQNGKLVEKIGNGKNESFRLHKFEQQQISGALNKYDTAKPMGEQILSTVPLLTAHHHNCYKTLPIVEETSVKFCDKNLNQKKKTNTKEIDESRCLEEKNPTIQMDEDEQHRTTYPTRFYQQAKILILRAFLILWRDKSLTASRIGVHFFMAVFLGIMYYGIGNDAHNAFNNFRYIFFTSMFIMYQAFCAILVKFPLEFPIVSREYFNRWYSLRAYYLAITLADLPTQFICSSGFVVISYWMTNQPLELFRLVRFGLITFLNGLVGQSIGLAVSASFSLKLGAIIGPFFISPFFTFSGFFLQLKDAQPWMHWLFHASFLKYTFEGSTLAVFGYDRSKLECSKVYCHFTRPKIFLREVGMADADYVFAVAVLLVIFSILRILAFYIMLFRLRLSR